MAIATKRVKVNLLSDFKQLRNKDWRHIVYHGGRGSGKSFAVAWTLLMRAREEKNRILCAREVQNSIADSVHKLLKDLIDQYDLTDFVVQKETIVNTLTGSEFIFKGLKKDSQAIKSMEGIDICWVEEAQTVSQSSIDILIPTIRKDGSQIIWTFNRNTAVDPVWVTICEKPDNKTFICHINSDALEKVGLLPQTLIDEREKLKANDERLYRHIWLGEPMYSKDGSIFGDQLEKIENRGGVCDVPYNEALPVYTAWDLGIGDSTAIWFWQKSGEGINVIDYYEMSGQGLKHYAKELLGRDFLYGQHYLPHDAKHRDVSAGMNRVELLKQLGLKNITVLKRGSVETGIELARQVLSRCKFDSDKCKDGLERLRAYHYKYDEKNKIFSRQPEHDFSSHAADAFRYLAMSVDMADMEDGPAYVEEDLFDEYGGY